MSNTKQNYYEGMFLFPQTMAPRLQEAIEHVNELLGKAGAEVIAMKKWAEKPLAYPIRKSRRGVYLLTYFSCDPSAMAGVERDCTLSESLLRYMITRADHLTVEEMTAYDDRENLHVEAKMRADQSKESDAPKSPAPQAEPAEEPAAVATAAAVGDSADDSGSADGDGDAEDDKS